MIAGYITAVLFLVTVSKFLTKRLSSPATDRKMLMIHGMTGIALLVLTVVHVCLVWKLRYQRPAAMLVVGFAMAFCVLCAILSHVFSRWLGKKWVAIHRISSMMVFVFLILHVILWANSLTAYREAIALIPDTVDIDISGIPDGVYQGEYDAAKYIYAKVEVHIDQGRISAIDLVEHRNERGKPAERIIDDIIGRQSLAVDSISGATNSSEVIKQAVENAVQNASTK